MANAGLGLFDLANQRMAYLQQRQQVLAQNVANANTPGWQPRDLQPFAAALSGHTGVNPVRTSPMHLAGAHGSGAAGVVKTTGERSPDGNAVRLDDQLGKVADTETAQSTTTNLYSKFLSLYRTALGH